MGLVEEAGGVGGDFGGLGEFLFLFDYLWRMGCVLIVYVCMCRLKGRGRRIRCLRFMS